MKLECDNCGKMFNVISLARICRNDEYSSLVLCKLCIEKYVGFVEKQQFVIQ